MVGRTSDRLGSSTNPSLLSCTALLCAAAATAQSDGAPAVAEEVLQMKDAKQFREVYRENFHPSFKQQMSESQWIAAANQVADQIGDNKGRTLANS